MFAKILKATLAAVVVVPFVAGISYAQRRPAKTVEMAKKSKAEKPVEKPTTPKKVKSYSFMGDDIDGNKINPDGSMIWGVQAKRHSSLIRHRTHFMAEILRSAESL